MRQVVTIAIDLQVTASYVNSVHVLIQSLIDHVYLNSHPPKIIL